MQASLSEQASSGLRASSLLGDTIDTLHELPASAARLAIWRRSVPADVCAALVIWARVRAAFEAVVDVATLDVPMVLAGLAPGGARDWLAEDVQRLTHTLAKLSGDRRMRLRFGPIVNDRCRKFHVDYTSLRLITTYVGPATQWIDDHSVCRTALEDPPECPDTANRRILMPGGRVQQARAGDVLLLKGVHAGNGTGGAVHRSPPIDGSGCIRVVLVATTESYRSLRTSTRPGTLTERLQVLEEQQQRRRTDAAEFDVIRSPL